MRRLSVEQAGEQSDWVHETSNGSRDYLRRKIEDDLEKDFDLLELIEISTFVRARASYKDGNQPERRCDRCCRRYRGPAVYCSLICAELDA